MIALRIRGAVPVSFGLMLCGLMGLAACDNSSAVQTRDRTASAPVGAGDPSSAPLWWAASDATGTQGCDGCLRAVTWAARSKDVTEYAFDARIVGSPADDVFIPGAPQPYATQQAGLTGHFPQFLSSPAAFWPSARSHYYATRIDWEPRPDVRTSFMSGAPQRLDRRIRQVAVFADAEVERAPEGGVLFAPGSVAVRSYRLDYGQGSTGRSRLVRVWPIAGAYSADADYSPLFGSGFPLTGFDVWTPSAFAANPLVPNPWEFVWSDSATLDPDQETGPLLADWGRALADETRDAVLRNRPLAMITLDAARGPELWRCRTGPIGIPTTRRQAAC